MDRHKKFEQCQKELHELNNLLTTLTCCGGYLRMNDKVSPETKKHLEAIVNSAMLAGGKTRSIYQIINELVGDNNLEEAE